MTEDNVVRLRPADDEIAELNRTYAVVSFGSQVAIMKQGSTPDGRPDLSFMAVGHFETWMRNRSKLLTNARGEAKPIALAKYWLEHPQRRQFDGLVFSPQREVPGYFNLWTGFAVASRPDCCDKFLAHIRDNICRGSEELFTFTMGFFADIVQNPGNKKDTSLVLRGGQGAGKSKVAEVIGSLLGNHYVSVSDPRYVTGRFNKHMLSCLLLVADEGFWAGDHTAASKVRDLISGKKHPIELKGKEAEWVDNHIRLLVIGNADWIVPAGLGERRFVVLDVGEDHIQDHPYFAAIDEEMNNGGREALLYYLLNFDLKQVNLRKIPRTAALVEQQIASLTPDQAWWLDILRRGELPDLFDGCCCDSDALYRHYTERLERSGRSRKSMETGLGIFLRKVVGPDLTDRRSGDRSHRHYRFPSLTECRRRFGDMMKAEADLKWDDQQGWQTEANRFELR
jgi:hypothetical protein